MPEDLVMVEERRRRLLEVVRNQGRLVAADAAAHFGVSEDTIRRDLRILAGEGLIARVRGGALPAQVSIAPFNDRTRQTQPAVAGLADAMAQYVRGAATVVLDVGVMCLRVAERLTPGAAMVVITSSPAAAAAAASRDLRVLMLGGVVDPAIGGSVGPVAVEAMSAVRADVVVLGACAVHTEVGVSTDKPDEVPFKKALVASGSEVIVAATAERIGTASPFVVAAPDQLDGLFVEALVPAASVAGLADAGVTIHRV